MLDPKKEKLISFSDAAELIPFPVSASTVSRWATHGVRGVKLETLLIGNRRLTTAEAVTRLLDRLNQSPAVA